MGRFDQEGSSDLISTLRPCDTGGVKVKSCSMCQDSRTRHRTAGCTVPTTVCPTTTAHRQHSTRRRLSRLTAAQLPKLVSAARH